MMLTLNRGGSVVWLSEDDAKSVPALKTTIGLRFSTSTVPLQPVPWLASG
jgi:hypothetical protein